ncbi:TRL-like family protein [Leptospira kanakyensis]|uniref:TRL-like family protein n=1 Tax=Leptospira kanakyensis TaxID=2484968 RepID=A0A6N4PZC6_9LEPT|nr:TRL-like family protein [Leptospira kanakyensis]MCW7469555.1 TRL-like family protein [Leptospira kanakyensis]TGK50725.1 TRL-like family protein [Leptospira kanakyensis]TGK63674.1 TRL-like family protein [Leptospira kanakyensis]TGK69862.1 TRL-like family protein [Leptospira kanakyensis]
MKTKTILFIFLSALLLTNCAIGPTHGYIFTSTKFAGTFNPENNVTSTKEATDCQFTVLYLFSYGDAGAGSIAKKNGISKIATIDHSTTSLLTGFYRTYCTIVSGE